MNKTALTVIMSYLAGGWTLTEILHFALESFYISNVWSTLLLALLLAMIPTVIVFAFFNHRAKLKKIVGVSNGVLSFILLIALSIGKPLGTYANKVVIQNENNESEIIRGIKENYRIRIAIADFHNVNEADSMDWMEFGISDMIKTDLEYSDLFYTSINYTRDVNMKSESGIYELIKIPNAANVDYILTGKLRSKKYKFLINFSLYKPNGELIFSDSVVHKKITSAVDSVSERIFESVELPSMIGSFQNIPVELILSSSSKALEYYYKSYPWNPNDADTLLKAISYDSTFCFAYSQLAEAIGQLGDENLEIKAIEYFKTALKHRKRLSQADQLELLMKYYHYKNIDRAYDLAIKSLEMYPNNYYKTKWVLWTLLAKNEYFPQLKNYILRIYDQLDFIMKYTALKFCVFHGDNQMINLIKEEISKDPLNTKWKFLLLEYYYARKELDQSKSILNEIRLIEPEMEDTIQLIENSLKNYNIADITGGFGWGSYTRYYVRNKYGIPFAKLSRYNNQFPVFFLDKYRLTDGALVDSLLYNEIGTVFAMKANGYQPLLKVPDELAVVDEYIQNKKYTEASQMMDELLHQFPKHSYLIAYNQYVNFIKSGLPVDSTILGTYSIDHSDYHGTRKIFVENDKIYYVNPEEGIKRSWIPLSSTRFQSEAYFDWFIENKRTDSGNYIKHFDISFSLDTLSDDTYWVKTGD